MKLVQSCGTGLAELLLVRNGNILHRDLKRELMTAEDLMGKRRERGIEDLDEVRA